MLAGRQTLRQGAEPPTAVATKTEQRPWHGRTIAGAALSAAYCLQSPPGQGQRRTSVGSRSGRHGGAAEHPPPQGG